MRLRLKILKDAVAGAVQNAEKSAGADQNAENMLVKIAAAVQGIEQTTVYVAAGTVAGQRTRWLRMWMRLRYIYHPSSSDFF